VDNPQNILVVQTAFLGDVILTLPLVQVAKKVYPDAHVDFIAIPRTAPVLRNHPAIREVIEFDKREKDAGIGGLVRLARRLREKHYDVALVPHRSLRSALLVRFAGIPARVGFDRSAGRWFLTSVVPHRGNLHEVERNLKLLDALGTTWRGKELPSLYPSSLDKKAVDEVLRALKIPDPSLAAVAPGTVWNTKRWPKERYAELVGRFAGDGISVVLVGGPEDRDLCEEILREGSPNARVHNVAGRFTLLQSAELLRRARFLVCNDSAPLHLAVAMRTPVVAIFGATIPEFGFAPYGERDVVVQTNGLACRPCSIHGGDRCPIETFVCMRNIASNSVYAHARRLFDRVHS